MPGIKSGNKIPLIRLTECAGENLQLPACFQLRIVGQITGDDLFLMKVTHLNGYVTEDLPYSRSSVKNDRPDGVSLSL
jgi:hypothetical protein